MQNSSFQQAEALKSQSSLGIKGQDWGSWILIYQLTAGTTPHAVASLILQLSWTEELPSLRGVCLPTACPFWHTAAVRLWPQLCSLPSPQGNSEEVRLLAALISSWCMLSHLESGAPRGSVLRSDWSQGFASTAQLAQFGFSWSCKAT